TPKAFTEEGALLNQDYLKDHFLDVNMDDFMKYTDFDSGDWENIVPTKKLEENGKRPSKVKGIKIKKNELHWKPVNEKDIIGYRVYEAKKGADSFEHVGDVKNMDDLVFPIKKGS